MSEKSTPRRAWNQQEDDLVYKFVAEAIWMLNHGYGEEKIPGILPGAVVAGQLAPSSPSRGSSAKDVSSCCDPEDCGTEIDGVDSLTAEALSEKKQAETPSRVKTFVDSMNITRQVRLPYCNTLLDTIDWQALSVADKILRHRTPKSIRERWRNHLDPSINHGPWSSEEDEILFRAVQEHGTSWTYISSFLQGRPELQCKNRYYATVRKQRRRQRRVKHAEPTHDSLQLGPPSVASTPQKVARFPRVPVEDSRRGMVSSSSPWYQSCYAPPAVMPQQYMGGCSYYPSDPAQVSGSAMPCHSQMPLMMPSSLTRQPPQSNQWHLQQQQQQQFARQYWQPVASPSVSPAAQTYYPGNCIPSGMEGSFFNMPQCQPVHGIPASCSMKRPAEGNVSVGECEENKMRKKSAVPAHAQGHAPPPPATTSLSPRPDGFVQQRVASASPYHYQNSHSRSEDSLVSGANTLLMLSQTAACR